MSAVVDLLELPDAGFLHAWANMEPDERSALSADVRARGFARYRELRPDIEASVERARRKQPAGADHALMFDRGEPGVPRASGAGVAPSRWPAPLDLEALAERQPLAPQFIIPDWLPAGYASGIWGHGGAGKSNIGGLTLAVCLASGRDFFGLPVQRCRVLVLSCEDRADVLHWRLVRICAHLGVDLASLRGWLDVLDLVGHDAVLWVPDRDRKCFTVAYGELCARIEHQRTQVLIVDGITDTYGGNEIARAEIKRFVNALLALIPRDGAVFLIGHVDKGTARNGATGEGYSGSTAWHNAVRARWYLRPEMREGDEGTERTGELVLELQKSNLGRADQSIRLAWDDGAHVFTARSDGTGYANLDRLTQEREEQAGILAALRACVARDYVPAATSGRRTAYHVLEAAREFPDSLRAGKPAVRRFWKHIEALRHRGDIEAGQHRGSDRHVVAVLLPCGHAGNAK